MHALRVSSVLVMVLCALQLVSAFPVAKVKRAEANLQLGLSKPGISYSPYKGTPGNTACKTPEEVARDVEFLKDKYSMLRLYGLDCDQVKNVLPHARKHGMKLIVGIYEVPQLRQQITDLAAIVDGNWDAIHTVSIGNEFVFSGKHSVGEMIGFTNSARDQLRSLGFGGYVVTVEVFYKYLDEPSLCSCSDYVAANAHPFFDGNVLPEGSGDFLAEMVRQISLKCPDKKILITETGWPTQGADKGKAHPSKENQDIAIQSILKSQGNSVILFTAFDDTWKSDNPSTQNAEKHWGIN